MTPDFSLMLGRWEEQLRQLAERLAPFRCGCWSHSLGEATPYDGYVLGLEAEGKRLELGFSQISSRVPQLAYAGLCEVENEFRWAMALKAGPLNTEKLDRHLKRLEARCEKLVRGRLPMHRRVSTKPMMSAYGEVAGGLPLPPTPDQLAVYRLILRDLCGERPVVVEPLTYQEGGEVGNWELDSVALEGFFRSLEPVLPQLLRETLARPWSRLRLDELASPLVTIAEGPGWQRASIREFWHRHPRVHGIVRLFPALVNENRRQAFVMACLEEPGKPSEPFAYLLARPACDWVIGGRTGLPQPDPQVEADLERWRLQQLLELRGYTLVEKEPETGPFPQMVRLRGPHKQSYLIVEYQWLLRQLSQEPHYFVTDEQLILSSPIHIESVLRELP